MSETSAERNARGREAELRNLLLTACGQTERDFRKAVNNRGFVLRVSRRNGRPAVGTRDQRTDRINIHVNNGIVTEATIG